MSPTISKLSKNNRRLLTVHLLSTLLFVLCSRVSFALDFGQFAPELIAKQWLGSEINVPSVPNMMDIHLVVMASAKCTSILNTIEDLERLNQKYKASGLKITMSIFDMTSELSDSIKNRSIGYGVFIDENKTNYRNYCNWEIPSYYDRMRFVPYAFIFNKTGQLIWSGNPKYNLEMILLSVMNGGMDATWVRERSCVLSELVNAIKNPRGQYYRILESLTLLHGLASEEKGCDKLNFLLTFLVLAKREAEIPALCAYWSKKMQEDSTTLLDIIEQYYCNEYCPVDPLESSSNLAYGGCLSEIDMSIDGSCYVLARAYRQINVTVHIYL